MGGTCSTRQSCENCVQNLKSEKLEGRGHWLDIGIDWKIILGWIVGK
jgi:hypothetical protein